MVDARELAEFREALAKIDADLVKVLDRRAALARRLLERRAESPDAYVAVPSTAEIVEQALAQSTEFPKGPLERALREIIGACDALAAPRIVSVAGPAGGFAYVAAEREFGTSAERRPAETISEVFENVERRRAAFGVVPFETSSDGTVTDTLDALILSEARIAGEVTLECTYDLVSKTGNQRDVDNIYGTASALLACEATLKRDYPRSKVLDVKSSLVAEDLAREDHGAAAIVACWNENEPRGLRCVKSRIEDRAGIETRFVVIGHERTPRTGRDRTVLALAVGDDPGSLYRSLQPFADRGVNLTRIESRAARGTNWKFVFILELDGHVTDRNVLSAMDDVRKVSRHLKVLGSFPRPTAPAG